MKQFLAFLLACVLLLCCCGCTDKTQNAATEAVNGTAAGNVTTTEEYPASPEDAMPEYDVSSADSPLPGEEEASPADPELSGNPTGATEPVAPAKPSVLNPIVSAPSSDRKMKIYTDDSKYTPFRLPEAKYTRLSEAPLTEFKPSDEYGAVYPYAAAPIFSKGEYGGYSYLSGYHWGLADKHGRILTDGIYIDVDPLEYVDYESDEYESVLLPYWVVGKVENVRTVTEGEGEDSWSYADGDMLRGLVSMDGSFATPVKYRGYQAQQDCVIMYLDWSDAWSFDVYDLQGKLLFSGKDLPRRSAYSFSLEYGDGCFLATYYYDNEDGSEYAYYYLDRSGSVILGPYPKASLFGDGLACVSENGWEYGYIDKTGAWAIEPKYSTTGVFRDGQAIQERNGRQIVIDKSGKELLVADVGMSLSRTSFGYAAENWSDSSQSFYDFSGKLLMEAKNEGSIWWQRVKDGLLSRYEDGTVTVCSVFDPDKQISGTGDYVHATCALRDGKPVQGIQFVDYENERYWFATEDLSESWELTEGAPEEYGYLGYHKTHDPLTGEYIKRAAQNGKTYFFGEDDRLIGACPNSQRYDSDVIGGMLRTVTDFACTYTDSGGNVFFRYPLATVLDD